MTKFNEMGLNDNIIKATDEIGFKEPTDIQIRVIPEILNNESDIIGLAQTGTGKTAGYGLPVIHQADLAKKSVQVIILCPTRELCLQITKDFKEYSKYVKGFKTLAVYGGANISAQIKGLSSNPQVVVGTPGRTLDLIKRNKLKVNNIQKLILDEADEMLNMGFRDELDAILHDTPAGRQTLLFSATLPSGVKQLSKKYMNNPLEIVSGKRNSGTANVEHEVYTVKSADRYEAIKRILDINPGIYGIVFCRTREETRKTAQKLIEDSYPADAIHGDLSQAQRDQVMNSFRSRSIQLLVATDVAARGLDIDDLTHILNYNIPDDPEIYIHRSGRTGRAGKKGVSVILANSREGKKVKELERLTGQNFDRKKVPDGQAVVEKRLYTLMDKIESIEPDEKEIEPYWDRINEKLSWLERDDLLKRFVYLEFKRFIDYYKKSKDLNQKAADSKSVKSKSKGKSGRRGTEEGFTRFFINIGEKDDLKAHNLIGLINEKTKNRNIEVGKIDIFRNFSFFELDSGFTEQVLGSFKNTKYKNVKLTVEISKPEKKTKVSSKPNYSGKKKRPRKKRK